MLKTLSINSKAYWENRFTNGGETSAGQSQSRFFTKLALENLPSWFIEQISCLSLTLADWGCAQGDGTDVWSGYLDPELLLGVDFSNRVIAQAEARYPGIRFACENWLDSGTDSNQLFDIVFSSNTLQHFHRPYEVLNTLASRAKKALVLALPYKEVDPIDEQFYSFLPENIPLELNNGFRLIWSKAVDCASLPDTLSQGHQIFLVYAQTSWVSSLHLQLIDCEIGNGNTNRQIAHLDKLKDSEISPASRTMTQPLHLLKKCFVRFNLFFKQIRYQLPHTAYKLYLKLPVRIKVLIRAVFRRPILLMSTQAPQDIFINQDLSAFLSDLEKVLDKNKTILYVQPTVMSYMGNDFFSGGAERYAIDLNKILTDEGYDFYCIQYAMTNPWVRNYYGLTIIGLPDFHNQALFNRCVEQLAKHAALIISSPFTLVNQIKAQKIIGISHGIYWDHELFNSEANLIAKKITTLDTLVSVDTATINFIRSHHVNAVNKLKYIPNYVDHQHFKNNTLATRQKDELVILYPRRLYKPRGFWSVCEVIPKILNEFHHVRFVFCGKADELELNHVASLTKKYNDKITHIIATPEEMPEIYQNADIVLVPTVHSEGTSLSLIEAMASKKAVISTYVGGLTDLVTDRFNGLMVYPEDPDELYNAIKELILNETLRDYLSQNAYEKSLAFSIHHWKSKWLQIIKDMTADTRREANITKKTDWINVSLLHLQAPGVTFSSMKQRPQHLFTALSSLGVKCFFIEDVKQEYQSFVNKNLVVAGNKIKIDMSGSILYTYFAFHYDLIKDQKYHALIYDVLDTPDIHNDKAYLANHQLMLNKADIILTSSKALFDTYSQSFGSKIIKYIPNAATMEDFNSTGKINTKPIDFPDYAEKTIGYYGAIAEWFDYDLLGLLCNQLQDTQIVLIGPNRKGFPEEKLLNSLLNKHKNLFYLGVKKYEELVNYATYFDVSIIPFVDNEVTRNCSPVKLFEYMNIGVPIVTTNMPECRQYRSVLIAENHEDFVKQVSYALSLSKDAPLLIEQKKEAEENTWQARAKLIIECIHENLNTV